MGGVGCAEVRAFMSKFSPLALSRPWKNFPYHEARPIWYQWCCWPACTACCALVDGVAVTPSRITRSAPATERNRRERVFLWIAIAFITLLQNCMEQMNHKSNQMRELFTETPCI